MSDLPVTAPVVTPETEPFWAATAEGRLHLPRCVTCSTVVWYPRDHCPAGHDTVEWVDVEPTGTVYSFSVVRRGQGRWKDVSPYVVAYVDLDAGPRMLTNLVEVDPDAVAVGMPVTAVFDPTDDGPALVRFRPV